MCVELVVGEEVYVGLHHCERAVHIHGHAHAIRVRAHVHVEGCARVHGRSICGPGCSHGGKRRVLALELCIYRQVCGAIPFVLHLARRAGKAGVVAHHVLHAGRLHVELEIFHTAWIAKVEHGQPSVFGRAHLYLLGARVRVHGHAPPPSAFHLIILAHDVVQRHGRVVDATPHISHHGGTIWWVAPHGVGIIVAVHGGRIGSESFSVWQTGRRGGSYKLCRRMAGQPWQVSVGDEQLATSAGSVADSKGHRRRLQSPRVGIGSGGGACR